MQPLEEDTATHSSILAWRPPWTEEPTVHWVTKSRTKLKHLSMQAPTCTSKHTHTQTPKAGVLVVVPKKESISSGAGLFCHRMGSLVRH